MDKQDTAAVIAPQGAAGFDLDSVADTFTAEYEIQHPVTGNGTGAFLTLAGPEHPERKRIQLSLIRRARAEAMRHKPKPTDPEDDIAESRESLVKATLGWRGIRKAGQEVPFSPQAVAELYADPTKQWLVSQVIVAINDRELFIQALARR